MQKQAVRSPRQITSPSGWNKLFPAVTARLWTAVSSSYWIFSVSAIFQVLQNLVSLAAKIRIIWLLQSSLTIINVFLQRQIITVLKISCVWYNSDPTMDLSCHNKRKELHIPSGKATIPFSFSLPLCCHPSQSASLVIHPLHSDIFPPLSCGNTFSLFHTCFQTWWHSGGPMTGQCLHRYCDIDVMVAV